MVDQPGRPALFTEGLRDLDIAGSDFIGLQRIVTLLVAKVFAGDPAALDLFASAVLSVDDGMRQYALKLGVPLPPAVAASHARSLQTMERVLAEARAAVSTPEG